MGRNELYYTDINGSVWRAYLFVVAPRWCKNDDLRVRYAIFDRLS